jgi:hypothetical protein
MNLDRGREKAEFERQAWEDGAELFLYFVKKEGLDTGLIERFRNYSISCIESYSSEP